MSILVRYLFMKLEGIRRGPRFLPWSSLYAFIAEAKGALVLENYPLSVLIDAAKELYIPALIVSLFPLGKAPQVAPRRPFPYVGLVVGYSRRRCYQQHYYHNANHSKNQFYASHKTRHHLSCFTSIAYLRLVHD